MIYVISFYFSTGGTNTAMSVFHELSLGEFYRLLEVYSTLSQTKIYTKPK